MDNCCISVAQVYEKPNPKIPEGYRKIDFRPYKKGDTVLTTSESVCVVGGSSYGRPFIILEILPPKPEVIERAEYAYTPQPKTIRLKDIYGVSVQIPTGYKYLAFRPPLSGDYYISVDFCVEKAVTGSHGKEDPRIIVEKA
jgi:hypothetical protein